MANYKLEVRKQFGAFKALFTDAQGKAKETDHPTLDEVMAGVRKNTKKLDFEADTVIFRGIAYTSSDALVEHVRVSVY